MAKRFCTLTELAAELGIDRKTLWAMHKRGDGPVRRLIGLTPRYMRDDIETWIESRKIAERKGDMK